MARGDNTPSEIRLRRRIENMIWVVIWLAAVALLWSYSGGDPLAR